VFVHVDISLEVEFLQSLPRLGCMAVLLIIICKTRVTSMWSHYVRHASVGHKVVGSACQRYCNNCSAQACKSCKFKVLLPSEVFVAMLRVLIEGL